MPHPFRRLPWPVQTATLRPVAPDPAEQTQALIDQLRQRGHQAEADHLARQLLLHEGEAGLLFALREACETVLTGIEALDPVSQNHDRSAAPGGRTAPARS